MGKSCLAVFLAALIGLQPLLLYPQPVLAEEFSTPDQAGWVNSELPEISKQIDAVSQRHYDSVIYGKTFGADPSNAPDSKDFENIETDLINERNRLQTSMQKTLWSPEVLGTKGATVEMINVKIFYSVVQKFEALKSLANKTINLESWDKYYTLKVNISGINNTSFIPTLTLENAIESLRSSLRSSFFNVRIVNHTALQDTLEFYVNKEYAFEFFEKQVDMKNTSENIFSMAQYIAAVQLYESLATVHLLHRRDLTTLPEVPAALAQKFPVLKLKRQALLQKQRKLDQNKMITPLIQQLEKLGEEMEKEKILFLTPELTAEIFRARDKNADVQEQITSETDWVIQVYEKLAENESSPEFLDRLKTILELTDFDPNASKDEWARRLRQTIAQSKWLVVRSFFLGQEDDEGVSLSDKEKARTAAILERRAHEYLNKDLKKLKAEEHVAVIDSPAVFLEKERVTYNYNLWRQADNFKHDIRLVNEPLDFSLIISPAFTYFLDTLYGKKTTVETTYCCDEFGSSFTISNVRQAPLKAHTIDALKSIVSGGGNSYGDVRERFYEYVASALTGFRLKHELSPLKSQLSGQTDEAGNELIRNFQYLKNLIEASEYDPTYIASKLNEQLENKIVGNILYKSIGNRKQELLELITVGEKLGFFQFAEIGANPTVTEFAKKLWDDKWLAAYHMASQRKLSLENPILLLRLSDGLTFWEKVGRDAKRDLTIRYNIPGLKSIAKNLYIEMTTDEPPAFWEELAKYPHNGNYDPVVSTHLAKLEEIIQKDLQFVANEGATESFQLSKLNFSSIFSKQKDFSEEFKGILARSTFLFSRLKLYTHFQNDLQALAIKTAESSAAAQAYKATFDAYVQYGFLAVIGLSVAKWIAKFASLGRASSMLGAFEAEILAPVFGPGLKGYNITAMAWFLGDMAYHGYDIFGRQLNMRDRIREMSLSDAYNNTIITLEERGKVEGAYEKARLEYLIMAGQALALIPLFFGVKHLMGYITKIEQARTYSTLKDLTSKAGQQGGEVSLFKETIILEAEAAAKKVQTQFVPQVGKSIFHQPSTLLGIKIRQAAESALREVNNELRKWEALKKNFRYQFKVLGLKNWDLFAFDYLRKKFHRQYSNKLISQSEYWTKITALNELEDATASLNALFKKGDPIAQALVYRLAIGPEKALASSGAQAYSSQSSYKVLASAIENRSYDIRAAQEAEWSSAGLKFDSHPLPNQKGEYITVSRVDPYKVSADWRKQIRGLVEAKEKRQSSKRRYNSADDLFREEFGGPGYPILPPSNSRKVLTIDQPKEVKGYLKWIK